jgi:tetratricopeptide (TPR) repeat protein
MTAARECGDKRQTSASLEELGHYAVARGEYERATACYEEALRLSRELSNKPRIAVALLGLARVARAQADHQTAGALREEAHALGPGTNTQMFHQGRLLLAWGDYAGARSYYEEGLALPYALDEARGVAWALVQVGHAAWLQGDLVAANSYGVKALELFQGQEDMGGILASLEALAVAAMAQGLDARPAGGERAARLLGAGEALREALGLPATGWWRHPSERIREAVRAASLKAAFAAAWAEGQALPLEEAIAYALEEQHPE